MGKYLIKVDYRCREVKTDGKWFVTESKEKSRVGVVCNGKSYLPDHDCKKYEYSQACDEDKTCFWQEILEVKPFSEKDAKRLGARKSRKSELEAKCKT